MIADVVDQRSDGQARINNNEVSYGEIVRRDPEWDECDLPPGMFVRMPIVPQIAGSATITGYHTFVVDPDDSIGAGFLIR